MYPAFRAIALFALCLAATSARAAATTNFTFTTVGGKAVQLSDLKGKWVLVNFWATWCPQCFTEAPVLASLAKRPDFAVVSVVMDYGPSPGSLVMPAKMMGLPPEAVALGGSRRDPVAAFRQVGPVDFFPTSYLYNPKGDVVGFIPGQASETRVTALLQQLGGR